MQELYVYKAWFCKYSASLYLKDKKKKDYRIGLFFFFFKEDQYMPLLRIATFLYVYIS